MNAFKNLAVPGALLGLFVCGTATLSAQASTAPAPATAPGKAQPSKERSEHNPTTSAMGLFGASKLLGKDVVDSSDVKVGSLEDVVVEETGMLVAVVKRTDGELAGLPMEALTARIDMKADGKEPKSDEKSKIKEFQLTGAADKLTSAPVVKDVANIDRNWTAMVRTHFMAKAGDAATSPGTPASAPLAMLCVKKLIGMDVQDTAGKNIGDVKELVVTLPDSKLAYAVISTGGMLGMGATPRGIAWKSLTLDSSGKHFNVATDKATLEEMPSVDLDHLTARPDLLQANALSAPATGAVAQQPSR